ncbi:MAG: hypothetical protein AAGP08_09145, partial [Pseudomonadota bacterium]
RDASAELDGLDELFLPVDIGPWNDTVGTVENALVDDEIGEMIGALKAKGATVWAVFDSCHSGTVTRAGGGPDEEVRLRRLDPGALGIPDAEPIRTRGLPGTDSPTDPIQVEDGAFVAFYAAQTNETTPEKRLPRGFPERKSHGVFTFTLFEAMAANPGVTYRQLAQDILRRYAVQNLARSTPLFEGDLDLAVFGTDGAAPVRQWPLTVMDGIATIPAGHLHGIEDGMQLAVLESPADSDEAALGLLDVDYTETFLAELVSAEIDIEALPRGAYARLTESATLFGLTVALPKDAGVVGERLTAALEAGETLELFGPRIEFVPSEQDSDLRLAVLPESEAPDALWVLPSTGILSEAGISFTPAIRTGDKDAAELANVLGDTLNRIARAQNLLKMGGAFQSDALAVDITLQTRSPARRRLVELETVPVPALVPDDEVHALVTNEETFPVDLNVLYIGSDYSITHMFTGRLQPGDRLQQGLLRITDAAFGRDRVVILLSPASRGKAVEDLSFLQQDELPQFRDLLSPFAMAMREAGFGETTRAAAPMSSPGSDTPSPALLVFDIDTVAAR